VATNLLSALAMSTGRMPCAFNSRTRETSIEAGRPSRLGLGDALNLVLAPEVGLELGEYTQHVEEALPGIRAIDRLLCGL
jgi:hypothetical protein